MTDDSWLMTDEVMSDDSWLMIDNSRLMAAAWFLADDSCLVGCCLRERARVADSRADRGLKHVVLSEKWDKKASKYLAPSLPYPFTSKVRKGRCTMP